MKNKNHTTEEFDQWDAWAQATYRTGSTRPPKSRGGIIAFLLVLVIFLCGISTALGLMNIRLFRQLSAMETTPSSPVAFSKGSHLDPAEGSIRYPLGFFGQEITSFWQTYYDLPAGIYVVEVLETASENAQSLLPGDVLIRIDGVPISGSDDLFILLDEYLPGDQVPVTIYRGGQEHTLILTMESE